MPRLYISGTISSDPTLSFEQAKARFDAAKASLQTLGYEVISPVDMEGECGLTPDECLSTQRQQMPGQGQGNHSWECYLRGDLRAMLTCDGVALLPNWHRSTGARLEFNTAVACGLECRPLDEWPPLAVSAERTNGASLSDSLLVGNEIKPHGAIPRVRVRVPLLMEGTTTPEDRYIARGGVEWDDDPIPLLRKTLNDNDRAIGMVYDITRRGDIVYGTLEASEDDLPPLATHHPAVTLMNVTTVECDRNSIVSAMLRAVTLTAGRGPWPVLDFIQPEVLA